MLFFKKYYMISRAYSEPKSFFIDIPCILPKHDREEGHAWVHGSYECPGETFEFPTITFAQPPLVARVFMRMTWSVRNAGDSNIPRKNLRSTSHFIRPNIVFLFLLIILSSTKRSEYISDSSRTIYRKCISDISFFYFANSQPFSWDIRISRSSNDLKCSTMRAAPIALVRRRGGGMHGIPMMNYSISNLNWEVQYSK